MPLLTVAGRQDRGHRPASAVQYTPGHGACTVWRCGAPVPRNLGWCAQGGDTSVREASKPVCERRSSALVGPLSPRLEHYRRGQPHNTRSTACGNTSRQRDRPRGGRGTGTTPVARCGARQALWLLGARRPPGQAACHTMPREQRGRGASSVGCDPDGHGAVLGV
jgi:hypothetical protein